STRSKARPVPYRYNPQPTLPSTKNLNLTRSVRVLTVRNRYIPPRLGLTQLNVMPPNPPRLPFHRFSQPFERAQLPLRRVTGEPTVALIVGNWQVQGAVPELSQIFYNPPLSGEKAG